MTKRELIRQNERLRRYYEQKYTKPVKQAMKRYISSFTNVLKNEGVQALQRMLSNLPPVAEVGPPIRRMYVELGVEKANRSLAALRRQVKMRSKKINLGYNAEWTAQILQYFGQHLYEKVVLPISETTQNYIQLILMHGIEEGWSIERMVQEIERVDYLNGRVQRILRTESNRAINYGSKLAREKFEYKTQKRWIAVHDNRTRHHHLAADGQTVDSDGFFLVGGEPLEFPGDPNGSGWNTINCRCFSEDVAVRDASGSLIPKDGNQISVRVRGRLRRELQSILSQLT